LHGCRHRKLLARRSKCRLVARGWLAAMLHALAAHGAGAVGPLIVGEGSVVQEAGGIVWADGGAEIAGRHSLMVPFLNQVRAVDYASAACLLMRRDAFDQVRRAAFAAQPPCWV
jgi:GT2 family glycosyltransferase